jgi:ATP-binding cassette subfamily B protein
LSYTGYMNPNRAGFRSLTRDAEATRQYKIPKGTFYRVVRFVMRYKWLTLLFLIFVVLDAAVGLVNPLLYRRIIDNGILSHNQALVIHVALLVGVLSIADALFTYIQRSLATRISQSMLFDTRVAIFDHVQKMSLAFFTRTRTGALVSRLNSDVLGIRDAFNDILSSMVSNIVTVTLVLITMFILSWQLTLGALIILPVFIFPARFLGKKIQQLTKEAYDLNSDMNTMMVERFNVAGAQLAKMFGNPKKEQQAFSEQASRVRDITIQLSVYNRIFFITLGSIASIAIAVAYGYGGVLAIRNVLDVGTIVAFTAYLTRLYGPLTALSNVQVDALTALVSFDRVFEILDLKPTVAESAHPIDIPLQGAKIEFKDVQFKYPSAQDVSLASLESVAILDNIPEKEVLHGIAFVAQSGQLIALVGPSGAGKTTITQLLSRMYDPTVGEVCINGVNLRDASFSSLSASIGIVMQEAHMFHDTIRGNLRYAKPDATEAELLDALKGAQILDFVESLPQGLDTLIGDRGYRLSGGEKQRVAIARVLLKAPEIVILDEATAHLDSESEHAIQEAFATALKGRTSVVIAHRLSTVRNADQILVIEAGKIVERGRHDELLARGGLYADLYQRQFNDEE